MVWQEKGDERGERRKQSIYLFRDTGWSCEPFLPTLPLAVGAHKSTILMSTQERNRITSGLGEGIFRILILGGQSAGVSSLSYKNANYFQSFSLQIRNQHAFSEYPKFRISVKTVL